MSAIEATLAAIRARLVSEAEPAFRQSLQRFFKEPVEAYGVRTPRMRKIAREFAHQIGDWPPAQRNRLCTELWKGAKIEESAVAIEIYARFRQTCGRCEFRLFERWLDRFVKNWGHCDGLCCTLVAAALENEPALVAEVAQWATSSNLWKRRASAVSLVWEVRRGRNRDVALRTAGALVHDREEIVRKGAKWLLAETTARRNSPGKQSG